MSSKNWNWKKALAIVFSSLAVLVSSIGLTSCQFGGEEEQEQQEGGTQQGGERENDDEEDDDD